MRAKTRLRALLSILTMKDCGPIDETMAAIKFLMGSYVPKNMEEAYSLAAQSIYNQLPFLLEVDPELAGNTQSDIHIWAKSQEKLFGANQFIESPFVDQPEQSYNEDSCSEYGEAGEYSDGYPKDEPDWL